MPLAYHVSIQEVDMENETEYDVRCSLLALAFTADERESLTELRLISS